MITNKDEIKVFFDDDYWGETLFCGIQGYHKFFKNLPPIQMLNGTENTEIKNIDIDDIEVVITSWKKGNEDDEVDCLMILKTHQNLYLYLHGKFDGWGNIEYLTNIASFDLSQLIDLGVEKNYHQKINLNEVKVFIEKEQLEKTLLVNSIEKTKMKL